MGISALLKRIYKCRFLYFLVAPGLLYFFIFCYIPMGGVLIAFMDYKPFGPLFSNTWVGLKYFLAFFKSPLLPRLIRNTLIINGWNILIGFPIPIIFAILLNELRRLKYKKVVQTISYFPHFISWVIVYGLALNLFSPSFGLVNIIITKLGGEPINFLMQKSFFVPLVVGSGIFVNYGWGSIIYLAALTGIDQEYYEAAKIDGANKLRQIWHISLPGMLPIITLSIIGTLSGILSNDWQQILIMMGSGNNHSLLDVGDVIDYYVYRIGLIDMQYSFSAAAGIMKSIVGLILISLANKGAKMAGQIGVW